MLALTSSPTSPPTTLAGSFCVLVLNEFRVVTTWFVLKANSAEVAEGWMKKINAVQVCDTVKEGECVKEGGMESGKKERERGVRGRERDSREGEKEGRGRKGERKGGKELEGGKS